MPLIRWNPWSLSSLLDEDWTIPTVPGLNRLGQGLNIWETDNSIVAQAALPGIPEDAVDVSVEDGVVRVSGSTQETKEDKTGRKYYMSSISSSYNYSFKLPDSVLDKEPTAELENGVLTLTFNKKEVAPPKKVKVIAKGKKA